MGAAISVALAVWVWLQSEVGSAVTWARSARLWRKSTSWAAGGRS
jgi:hypothetical protein